MQNLSASSRIYLVSRNYIYIYIYIYIYDSQIVYHNPCFNLFILHNNLFDNQGGQINKNDDFLRFDIYLTCIHHWRILWSSYRRLAWVELEPTTTEFRPDALTDWAIRPWVQLTLRANFVQLLQFHCLFSVTFHFGYCIGQSPRLF